MKIPRPHIPISIRVQVAERQFLERGLEADYPYQYDGSYQRQLDYLLERLFGDDLCQLDHNPALENREQIKDSDGMVLRYIPDANDSDYLIYRATQDHKIKTYVRGDGAQRSDAGQRRYLKKIARNRDPKQRKTTIRSRGFDKTKTRKFDGTVVSRP